MKHRSRQLNLRYGEGILPPLKPRRMEPPAESKAPLPFNPVAPLTSSLFEIPPFIPRPLVIPPVLRSSDQLVRTRPPRGVSELY